MNDRDELLRFEQLCLEQADLCRDGLSRTAFLDMAENYRAAAGSQEQARGDDRSALNSEKDH